jgi:hypothetical protein
MNKTPKLRGEGIVCNRDFFFCARMSSRYSRD